MTMTVEYGWSSLKKQERKRLVQLRSTKIYVRVRVESGCYASGSYNNNKVIIRAWRYLSAQKLR